jgi:hypothetical protein
MVSWLPKKNTRIIKCIVTILDQILKGATIFYVKVGNREKKKNKKMRDGCYKED